MKYFIVLIFTLLSTQLFAQINKNIYNTWVNAKVTFSDGSPLPDEHPLKYTYIKYQFSKPDRMHIATVYFEKGVENLFEIKSDKLLIKSPEGGLMNSYRITSIKDTLVLLQNAFEANDSSSLKFYFVPESVYQQNLTLKPSDIFSIKGKDTIYQQSAKIYASYKGESFRQYIYDGISEKVKMDGRAGHFLATFVVDKSGLADSVKILKGIDNLFDERFIKVFSKSKKSWKPATLAGKPVSVRMSVELRYSTSATVIPAYFASQKANEAYLSKDYELAIYYYDQALQNTPTDKENLFKRGMCKLLLGNIPAAREDWLNSKQSGENPAADAMLEKYPEQTNTFNFQRPSLSQVKMLEKAKGSDFKAFNFPIVLAKGYVEGIEGYNLANPAIYRQDQGILHMETDYFYSIPDSTIRLIEYSWQGKSSDVVSLKKLFEDNKQIVDADLTLKTDQQNTGEGWAGRTCTWENEFVYCKQFLITGDGTYRLRLLISWK
ncbi:energy transducer TonB [Mucilaginibacter litoreus]|uniref:Energy transducer TonB n=1 Tax=Mucilaginibacter litoreus TaxID=1048221 RepID=A0ABW3ARA4_9SPHI